MTKDSEKVRRQPRIPAAYEYFMSLGGHTYSGVTREVSPFGAGLVAEIALDTGEEVDLSVVIPDSTFKLLVKGVVRSCIENPDRTGESDPYILGIEFTESVEDGIPLITQTEDGTLISPSHTVTINAPARKCYRAAFNFVRFPEWSSNLEKVKILEKYQDGRGRLVEFNYSFFIRKVHYVLEYSYDDEDLSTQWVKAGGDEDVLEMTGSSAFRAREENLTYATNQMSINLSFAPSKRLVNWGTSVLMRKELLNFKKFVEGRN